MYCGIVKKKLNISICPIARCMWQDRETKECRYTDKHLTVREFCELTKQKEPSEQEIEVNKKKIIEKVQ